jgi:hypothetical protein
VIVVTGLLVYQACKMLLGPVAQRVLGDFQQAAADRIEQIILRLVRGDPPPTEEVTPPAPPTGGVAVTDAEIVADIEAHPQQAEELRRVLEEKLGVPLGGPEAAVGTDAWFVSAYEAVLWRAACTAGWEDRPIAVAGALQGSDWVTVCVPVPHQHLEAGQVIDPATMWRTPAAQDRRRPVGGPPVDFFVRRVEHAGQAETEAAELNKQFIKTRRFDPGPPGPSKQAWHRVDGLSRGWVLLQGDDALRKHIEQLRGYMFPVNLDTTPPKWEECPEAWQLLMDIPDPVAGIAALSDGLDKHAVGSAAVVAAARAVLGHGRPG